MDNSPRYTETVNNVVFHELDHVRRLDFLQGNATLKTGGIHVLYSLDAGIRDAVLAPQLFSARLASLLRQNAPVALLFGVSSRDT